MGFYRIIKNVVRFILYQLPKKWLIMIIFALVMVFGLTKVQAMDYNGPNYIEYVVDNGVTIRISSNDAFYIASDNTNSNYLSVYKQGSTTDFAYVTTYRNGNSQFVWYGGKQLYSWANSYTNFSGVGDVAFYDKNGTLLYEHFSFINPSITTAQSDIEAWNFTNLVINGGSLENSNSYGSNYFSLVVDYEGIETTIDIDNYKTISNSTISFNIPRSVLIDNPSITSGRSVSFKLLYYKAVEGGRDIIDYSLGSYTFNISSSSQETINNDQTLDAISNVNNSINETNNFLQDTNINSSDKTLPSMNIQDSQVVTQVDGSYSNFFNEYISLFGSELPTSISLYIPNMSTGGIASTITIPSNYVKSHLTGVSIPLINVSLLELIEMIWYVVFAFWFLGFATNLVTIIYSGEIMDNKGLRSLTKAYTGVSKNML